MRTQFKIIVKGLWKNKKYFFISTSMLFITFSFFLMLFTYVRSELNYDIKIPGHKNIYRVTTKVTQNGDLIKHTAKSQMPLGEALKEQIPSVVSYSRLLDEECLFRYDDIKMGRQKTYWVDNTFPDIFSIEIVEGNAADALTRPFTGMISEEIAKKFFGDESPVGKVLVENEGLNMEIRGVFKKPEHSSHFDYDFLMSYETVIFYNSFQDNWDTDMFYTYIQLAPNADVENVKTNMKKFAEATYLNHHEKKQQVELILQPMASIHLGSHLENELSVNNKAGFVIILAMLGLFTLLVSLLNYSGLITSRYKANQKSLVMIQVYGSRNSLVSSIIIETMLIHSLAFISALIFTLFCGNSLFDLINIPVSVSVLHTPILLIAFNLFCILFCSIIAIAMVFGYLVLNGISANQTIRKGKSGSQASLVIMQFSFSIFLIIFLAISIKQVHFMKNTNPGYDMGKVLALHTPRTLIMNRDRISRGNLFIEKLKREGLVESGCITSDLPGKPVHTDLSGFVWLSSPKNQELKVPADWISVDTSYFKTLGISLIAGLNFHGDIPSNADRIILNEKAVKDLGFESPEMAIGARIRGNSASLQQIGMEQFTIAGVVSDFHQEGLQEAVKPIAFTYSYFYLFGLYAVKVINPSVNTLASIQENWETLFPDDPFDYFFLDQRFHQQYKNETLFFKLCLIFGIIATLIACYGLFGISIETIAKRKKEISVRRVNGATAVSISSMLGYTYGRWVLYSFMIAAPCAYLATQKWLESFAYKTTLSWWVFVLSGFAAIVIALLTISGQTWQVATMNPAESLRNE